MNNGQILIIIFNICGWPVIQVFVGAIYLHLSRKLRPLKIFHINEDEFSNFYIKYLKIYKWKGLVPDGAGFINPQFSKKKLSLIKCTSDRIEYLYKQSVLGLYAHLSMIVVGTVVFTYNPLWAYFVMVGVGILLNVPCIFVLHFNYLRCRRLLVVY